MRFLPAIILGRLARFAIRLVRPGGGSALPGLIVSKLAPNLLEKTLESFPRGLVVITGSAGKSSTTKMVVAIARAHGLEVFTNPSTANIEQGFYSAILERSNLLGQIPGDIAILEMDEGHAAKITERAKPSIVTVLNVLEDQIDRFVDPSVVRDMVGRAAAAATQQVLLNADDQNLLQVAQGLPKSKVRFFGVDDNAPLDGHSPLTYAPTYLAALTKPLPSSELVGLKGQKVSVATDKGNVSFSLANTGLHYALDAVAAIETSIAILGSEFNLGLAGKTLQALPPVFARGETVNVRGVDMQFVLVQNPTSFQLNLESLADDLDRIMVAIGRDVHDPSWLWTVSLDKLKHVDVVSGYNFAEMELRLAYDEVPVDFVIADLEEAFDKFLSLPKAKNGLPTVIFSADAMRRTRRMLGFTSPEQAVQ